MPAIEALVERSSRVLLLFHFERITSERVVAESTRHVQILPVQLSRSVTWNQGKKMARRASFAKNTGAQVSLRDPTDPWQHGANVARRPQVRDLDVHGDQPTFDGSRWSTYVDHLARGTR